jgi:N-acetylglucosamine kinase-like BadF-type ATPase
MLLVADSGSTKVDWILCSKDEKEAFNTAGINPYFHNERNIRDTLMQSEALIRKSASVTAVRFFGAGCSSPERNEIVERSLSGIFLNAEISVDHDVMGSALATCGDTEGISCILGTGSNSCYYDGKNVEKNNYGLGFIMGDEGSGSYYGKKLLTHYLYGLLPEDIKEIFELEYGVMSKEDVIKNVYNNPSANVWLASFARFFSNNKTHPWVISMVKEGMQTFFNLYVCRYPRINKLTVHFVGSLSFIFNEILFEVARENNITLGKVIKRPIDELANYFLEKES